MKDSILLLCAGVVVAGIAALMYRITGEYSPVVSFVFAVIGVIVYIKRRR